MSTNYTVGRTPVGDEQTIPWYLYQTGHPHPLGDFHMNTTDFMWVLSQHDMCFATPYDGDMPHQDPPLYLYAPTNHTLIQINQQHSSQGWFAFKTVFGGRPPNLLPMYFDIELKVPFGAHTFKWVTLDPTPEFQSAQEALEWLTRET